MKQQTKHGGLLSRLIAVAILCFGFAFFQASPILAVDDMDVDPASPSIDADDPTDDVDDEDITPSFKNPAQAAHASQLANEVASRGSTETEAALSDVEAAQEGLEEAMATGTPEEIEQATTELEAAEKAYADAVAELTGVVSKDLVDMREAGMGWGNIAKELGVHPSILGLGHTKGKQKNKAGMYADPMDQDIAGSIQASEVAEATARNTRSGYAKGHGLAMNTGVDEQTTGLGFGGKSKSRGKGHSGASGLGSGQGQAGNSGDRGGASGGNSGSSSPGNSGKSGNSSSSKGGAGVAGKDGNPGGGNSGNSNGQGGGRDKSGKSNNGKSGDKGNKK